MYAWYCCWFEMFLCICCYSDIMASKETDSVKITCSRLPMQPKISHRDFGEDGDGETIINNVAVCVGLHGLMWLFHIHLRQCWAWLSSVPETYASCKTFPTNRPTLTCTQGSWSCCDVHAIAILSTFLH